MSEQSKFRTREEMLAEANSLVEKMSEYISAASSLMDAWKESLGHYEISESFRLYAESNEVECYFDHCLMKLSWLMDDSSDTSKMYRHLRTMTHIRWEKELMGKFQSLRDKYQYHSQFETESVRISKKKWNKELDKEYLSNLSLLGKLLREDIDEISRVFKEIADGTSTMTEKNIEKLYTIGSTRYTDETVKALLEQMQNICNKIAKWTEMTNLKKESK